MAASNKTVDCPFDKLLTEYLKKSEFSEDPASMFNFNTR